MARLPVPGADENTWGNVLNDFLAQAHNTDGTIKDSAVTGLAGQPVSAAAPSDNDVLTYNSGTNQWEPSAPGAVLPPDAADVPFAPVGTISATDVQAAVAEVATDADTALSAHAADTTGVHGIADTSVLETTAGSQAKVDAHVNDATDAHDASAISFQTTGTITATDAQNAIAEVATDAASALSTHAADATIHSSGREVAYAEVTSDQTGITSTFLSFTDITGLSVTIPSGGIRPIYITARLNVTNDTAGAGVIVGITTNGFSEIVAAGYVTIPTAGRVETITVEARIPAGMSGTYKVVAQVTSGSATVDNNASAPKIVSFIKAVEA